MASERATATGRAALLHSTAAGRARLDVGDLKSSPEFAGWLERRLPGRSGIVSVRANSITGRVVVRFDPAQSAEAVVTAVNRCALHYAETSAIVSFGAPAPSPKSRPATRDANPRFDGSVRVHHAALRGRVRLEIDGLRRNPGLAHWLETKLPGMRGVESVRASAVTGRLLARFDPLVDLSEVISAVRGAVDDFERSGPQPVLRGSFRSAHHQPWHAIEAEESATLLRTSPKEGLSAAEARRRLSRSGRNRLPIAKPRSHWNLFASQFATLPVALLTGSAALAVVTGGLTEAVVILGVVVVNGVIGYGTERSTARSIASLDSFDSPLALVVRGGHEEAIAAENIVPGDVIVLRPGSNIPADARIVSSKRLSVCEAPLTGEAVPVDKLATCTVSVDTPLPDRANMVFSGTVVTGGSGTAVVTATGQTTEIGVVQRILDGARPPATPMEQELEKLGRVIFIASGLVCAGVFGLGLLRGQRFAAMLKSAVALAVAAVPEGLPAVATTTLALAVAAMRKRGALVRHLSAVETLGSTGILCLDKTGTLTLNRMTVSAVRVGESSWVVREGRLVVDDVETETALSPDMEEFLTTIALCNEAVPGEGPGAVRFEGSPTETALLELAAGTGLDVAELRRRHPRLVISHRANGRAYMKTIHAGEGDRVLLAVKGNPEEVLDLCGTRRHAGVEIPLDGKAREEILAENDRMAGDALRVLGVAIARGARGGLEKKLTWLGLVGMADPLRDGTPELIETLRRAGIATLMITGDQEATAQAIASELGVGAGSPVRIVDAGSLEDRSNEELLPILEGAHGICRASPAHKLRIVEALQSAGRIVAMTGDGVNDAPALRAANSGIAMGDGGTELVRSVADVVLEKDDLQALVASIRQGRTVRANTRKALHFLLSTNLSEIVVMAGAIGAGYGAPLGARQLLWLNLISDVCPGLALAVEPAAGDIMERGPGSANASILDRREWRRIAGEGVAISAAGLGTFAYGVSRYGVGGRANSMAFLSLASSQLLHALTCRSRHRSLPRVADRPANPALLTTVAATLGMQIAAAFVPGFRGLLGLSAISLTDAALSLASSALPLIATEATKPKGPSGMRIGATPLESVGDRGEVRSPHP